MIIPSALVTLSRRTDSSIDVRWEKGLDHGWRCQYCACPMPTRGHVDDPCCCCRAPRALHPNRGYERMTL